VGMRPGPRAKEFGDPNYKGRGRIKCAICGKPLSKHERPRPCPELKPGERLTLTKSLRTQTDRTGRGEKQQRHEDARDEQETESKVSESKAKGAVQLQDS